MTPEQYERWKDFSLRMAEHAFPHYREANREKIKGYVRDFFSIRFDDNEKEIASVEDWDSGPAHVCDYASDFETEYLGVRIRWPGDRTEQFLEGATREQFAKTYKGWDGFDYDDFWRYRAKSVWASLVRACVRSGLDVASSPSAGVLGFDLGDLRRMYPEGLPEWVKEFFAEPIDHLPDSEPIWL